MLLQVWYTSILVMSDKNNFITLLSPQLIQSDNKVLYNFPIGIPWYIFVKLPTVKTTKIEDNAHCHDNNCYWHWFTMLQWFSKYNSNISGYTDFTKSTRRCKVLKIFISECISSVKQLLLCIASTCTGLISSTYTLQSDSMHP